MKPQQFLFHVPGIDGLFDFEELVKKDLNPHRTIEIRDCQKNTSIGKMPVHMALQKFR